MKQILCLLLVLCLTASVRAQSAIDWFTIDASGSAAASANYIIDSTVGQADAVTITSANYSIVGGFWALQNLGPASGLPVLHIAVSTPGNVLLSWPSPSTGFVLQENITLPNPGGWVDVGGVVSDNGTERSIIRPAPGVTRFYRLQKP